VEAKEKIVNKSLDKYKKSMKTHNHMLGMVHREVFL